MDDFLFYSVLGALLIGFLIASLQKIPGCAGMCEQCRKKCNCGGAE